MYFFRFHAVPTSSHPDCDVTAGAYAICWVDQPTLSKAEELARDEIEQNGWEIRSLEESRIVERSDYEDNLDSLRYFDEAVVDGAVFVFYQFPANDET